ncbi:MAG: DNA-directed RNA polymerase subunit omega [Bdellovibrionaceae bacterium]|nr:DNA-directed RNA polymerase subunit omega [Pseudobdellovibrionaceae bacterium]
MARVTVEDCLAKIPNRFALVVLAAKRVRQILKGAEFTDVAEPKNKEVVNSLREIAAEKVYNKIDESQDVASRQIESDLV